jgi:hypothetical protein
LSAQVLCTDVFGARLTHTLLQPSSYIRLDLVDPHQKVHPDRYGFDRCVRHKTNPPSQEPVDNFLGLPSYGELMSLVGGTHQPPTSGLQQPISSYVAPWGTIVHVWFEAEVSAPNGTVFVVPNGDYRPLIRALKPGLSWEDKENYETWLGPIIRVANF